MNKNKVIKQQARLLLKGNWVPVISGFVIVILALLAVFYTQFTLLYAFDQLNADGELYKQPVNITTGRINYTLICIAAGSSAALLLLSPLFNGAIRLCAKLTLDRTANISEMFYCFRSFALYVKTVLLNFVIFFLFTVTSSLLDPYIYVSRITGTELDGTNPGDPLWWVMAAAFLAAVLIDILLYTVLVHFPLLVYAFEPQRGVCGCTFALLPFIFRNLGKALSLTISFFGWALLCFFVVPVLYAAPYYAVASADSVKWMLQSQEP